MVREISIELFHNMETMKTIFPYLRFSSYWFSNKVILSTNTLSGTMDWCREYLFLFFIWVPSTDVFRSQLFETILFVFSFFWKSPFLSSGQCMVFLLFSYYCMSKFLVNCLRWKQSCCNFTIFFFLFVLPFYNCFSNESVCLHIQG